MSTKEQLDSLLSLFHNRQFSLFEEEAKQMLEQPQHPLIKAKILSWLAQSYQQQNKLKDGINTYEKAIHVARTARDNEGVLALEEQYQLLVEQLKAQSSSLNHSQNNDPLHEGISQLRVQNTARAETLLLGSVAQADEEGDPKGRVLSRLALSRIPMYQDSMIKEALEIAREDGDMNLITAVKKTMDQLGHRIKPHVF